MNYQKIYYNLIHQNKEYDCYTEKHHIIPRCIGGSDDKSNLVTLNAREHFVAHWLLTKIYIKNRKLKYAFIAMRGSKKTRKLKSWEFKRLKNESSQIGCSEETKKKISKANKGRIPWNLGIPSCNKGKTFGEHSKETKEKISIKLRGKKRKPHSEETKQKMRETRKLQICTPHSKESKEKISKSNIGRTAWNKGIPAWNKGIPHSEETKMKIRNSLSKRGNKMKVEAI